MTEIETKYEFGLPHRLLLDLYAVGHQTGGSGVFGIDSQQVEVRYALADWNKIWGNPTLYAESKNISGAPSHFEGKLALVNHESAPGVRTPFATEFSIGPSFQWRQPRSSLRARISASLSDLRSLVVSRAVTRGTNPSGMEAIMRRVLRIALIVIGVLVVLLAIAPFVISVDTFRPTIEQKASAALGRSVHLGRLSLSIFSGSLSAEDLAIGDDPAFSESPFLTAKSLKVGVEVLPLILSRTLKVTGITIDTPEVTLLRTPAGQWNFASLASLGGKSNTAQTQAAPDISIRKIELLNGRIVVARKGSEKRSTYDHVTLTASDVSMTSAFPVALGADLPSGGKLTLDGRAGPLDRTDASLTPVSARLVVKSLNLATTGFLDASAGLGGIVDLDSALESRGGEAAVKGTATLSKALLVAGGSPAGVPVTVNVDTTYNLKSSVGVLNPSSLAIGKAAARLSGTYNTAPETTLVQLRMRASDMPASDLQAFLPALDLTLPRGSSLQAGTMNADLQIAGPVNKLIVSGNVGMANAKLAGFDLGSKMAAVASLAGFKTGKDLDIEKLTTDLRVAANGVEAANFLAVVPGLGSLTGAGTVDARNGLDFKMVAQLMKSPSAPAAPAASAETNAQPAKSGGLAGLLSGGLSGLKAGGLKGAVQAVGAGCKGGITVPFQVKGTTTDPKFVPDVGGLAAATLKSKLGCM